MSGMRRPLLISRSIRQARQTFGLMEKLYSLGIKTNGGTASCTENGFIFQVVVALYNLLSQNNVILCPAATAYDEAVFLRCSY